MIQEEKSRHEYYAVVSGLDLAMFGDREVTVPPLIRFKFSELAADSQKVHGVDPNMLAPSPRWRPFEWRLKVRHKSFLSAYSIGYTRPKVTLSRHGSKNVVLRFDLPRRPLYQDMNQVVEDLSREGYVIRSAQIPVSNSIPHVEDELSLMRAFNDSRYERIKDFPKQPEEPLPDNVVDFLEYIEQRKLSPVDVTKMIEEAGLAEVA